MIVLPFPYDAMPHTGSLDPVPAIPTLDAAYARLEQASFLDALWQRKLEAWSSDAAVQAAVATRLGWLGAADTMRPLLAQVRAAADEVRAAGFTDVVLLGMGGSSLAPEVIRQVIGVREGWPRFRMLDSVNPEAVRAAMAQAETSLFILASKSGGTIEPTVMAREARRRLIEAGHADWGSRTVAITDPDTLLHRQAVQDGFRHVFVNPPDVGGRFSALTLFGLVPAALMGLPVETLVDRGAAMAAACRTPSLRDNPGLALGVAMAAGAGIGRDKLTLLPSPSLRSFGLWVEQLLAESTGKDGQGIIPITGEPSRTRYGADRLVVTLTLAGESPDTAALDALRATGAPVVALTLEDPLSLAAEFMRWEVATATAGWLLGVNPFSEPDVARAKAATGTLIARHEHDGQLPVPAAATTVNGVALKVSRAAAAQGLAPEAFLFLVRPGDYLTLLAYVSPADRVVTDALGRFRDAVGARSTVATSFGYGPRYLHSTGQLHKGGPDTGLFIIVTGESAEDLAVPDAVYSFGVLEAAQAVGDFTSLDDLTRRCLLLRLPKGDPAALEAVLTRLLAALPA